MVERHLQDERLADWVDGRLSEKDLERLEAEFRVNPALYAAAERYRRMVERLRDELHAADSDSDLGPRGRAFTDEVMAGLDRPPVGASRRRWFPLLASAAAAAAMVLVYVVVRNLPVDRPAVERSAAYHAVDETAPAATQPQEPRGVAPADGAASSDGADRLLQLAARENGVADSAPPTESGARARSELRKAIAGSPEEVEVRKAAELARTIADLGAELGDAPSRAGVPAGENAKLEQDKATDDKERILRGFQAADDSKPVEQALGALASGAPAAPSAKKAASEETLDQREPLQRPAGDRAQTEPGAVPESPRGELKADRLEVAVDQEQRTQTPEKTEKTAKTLEAGQAEPEQQDDLAGRGRAGGKAHAGDRDEEEQVHEDHGLAVLAELEPSPDPASRPMPSTGAYGPPAAGEVWLIELTREQVAAAVRAGEERYDERPETGAQATRARRAGAGGGGDAGEGKRPQAAGAADEPAVDPWSGDVDQFVRVPLTATVWDNRTPPVVGPAFGRAALGFTTLEIETRAKDEAGRFGQTGQTGQTGPTGGVAPEPGTPRPPELYQPSAGDLCFRLRGDSGQLTTYLVELSRRAKSAGGGYQWLRAPAAPARNDRLGESVHEDVLRNGFDPVGGRRGMLAQQDILLVVRPAPATPARPPDARVGPDAAGKREER